MAKNIKEVHPKAVVCYRAGRFYVAIGKDSYILSYLFGYKIGRIENDIPKCGFPVASAKKVMSKLENNKIDYLLLDVKNNYDVEEKNLNKNLNRYDEFLKIGYKTVKSKQKVDTIMEKLKTQVNRANFIEKVQRIEEIVDEN